MNSTTPEPEKPAPRRAVVEGSLLINAAEVAALLSISKRTLWRLVSREALPPPLRLGGTVRWRRAEVEAWIAAGCPDADDFSTRKAN